MILKDTTSKEYALWFSGYLKDALENLKQIKDRQIIMSVFSLSRLPC